MKVLSALATSCLFKNVFKLEPGNSAILLSIISFPWSVKFIYGLISDNYPIYGSKRKPYLIIMSALSAICVTCAFFYSGTNYHFITALLCMQSVGDAFNSVVIEAILV